MGTPHPPEESILFIAALYCDPMLMLNILPELNIRYGDILFESPEQCWDHSDYYKKEMGYPLFRKFLFYSKPFDPLLLPVIKIETNSIEQKHAVDGKRRINIDPGYLMSSRIVIASSKDYSHRIYLGKGIYGELALYFKGGVYHPLPYTYKDYRSTQSISIFGKARDIFKKNLGKN